MFTAGGDIARVWKIWLILSLILGTLLLLVAPAAADNPVTPFFKLDKVAEPPLALTSSPLNYTLTVQNIGNEDSETLTITDTVPSRVTLESIGQDGILYGNVIAWTFASLPQGSSTFVTFTVETGNVAGEVINVSYGVTATNAMTPTYGLPVTTTVLPGIVTNEIMQNPDGVDDSVGEWFELYNPTDKAVNLNGWTIKDRGTDAHTIAGSLMIPAGGYVVLGINGDPITNGGVNVDYVYSDFSLDQDEPDEIILLDAGGHEIDHVEYDSGPEFPDPNGASMELVDPALDNNAGHNWTVATVAYSCDNLGTPGVPNGKDVRSPLVCDTDPADGATDIDIYTNISATFHEAVDQGTLDLTLTGPEGPVAGTVSYNPDSFAVIFDPDDALDSQTNYTATIPGTVTDQVGNPMGSAYIWSFTTASRWPPQAAFTVSDDYPVVGETVTFTNQSTGSEPLTYQWAFGDGETSQEASPSHAYNAPADYTIALTVTNPWGEDTTTAQVHVGHSPVAAFSYSPMAPLAGEDVWFTNESTGTEPLSYAWDFGDGSPMSTKRDPEHIYTAPGTYTVILTATNRWGLDTAASIVTLSGWSLICIPQRTEITGIGMGDYLDTINPQTLSLADPDSVDWLVAQVAGRYRHDSPTPDGVIFTTDAPQSITLNEPSNNTPQAYTFEANLQPAHQITAFVSNPGDGMHTPRGLILYANRETAEEWTSVGKTTNHYVWYGARPSHTEVLTFPPLAQAADLFVTAAVIDNDDDTRPLVLEATAGGVTGSVTELSPTHGVGLNIVELRLQQVPNGTSQVSVTLQSPSNNGDSLVLVGLNVSYPCAAPMLLGAVDMEGRPAKPDPSWSIPLTIWLTPDGSSTLAYTFTTTTDQNGEFGLSLEGVAPALYDIRVKGNHTLRNLAPNVSLVAGENHYFFGTLLEGDVETVDTYNQVLKADAHLMRKSFNKCEGDPGFVANADLDESGCVSLADFTLLTKNFGKEGDIIISDTTHLALAPLQVSDASVLIALSADKMAPAVDETVTLTLDVDPRGSPINGGMIQLNFDPALVEVMEVNLTDQLPLVLAEPSVDNGQGVLRFTAAVLDQTITEKFTIATLSLKVKAATSGTTISFADTPLATNVVRPAGNFLVESRGITLGTETQGQAENAIYLPIIMR